MKKKTLIILIICFFILTGCSKKNDLNLNNGYIEYSKGRIFIGNKKYLSSLDDIKEGDVLILDQRNAKAPNIKIYNSYLINDILTINEILNIIYEYEKINPSNWDRSIESMRNEWVIHNLLYYSNKEINRTKDVDLNNIDEEKYKNIIKNIINN